MGWQEAGAGEERGGRGKHVIGDAALERLKDEEAEVAEEERSGGRGTERRDVNPEKVERQ